MSPNEISSIGQLNNHDGSICLSVCLKKHGSPMFISVPKEKLDDIGGIDALRENKQMIVDLYSEHGLGRP